MINNSIHEFFTERFAEIDDYLSFLDDLEKASSLGAPTFNGTQTKISTSQKKILYSSFYLQLYSVIEATVTQCIEEINSSIVKSNLKPTELKAELMSEWVKDTAKTNDNQTPENRLKATLLACNQLMSPLSKFKIHTGGGGNWDDLAIEKLCKRIDCEFTLPREIMTAVKTPVRDQRGTLGDIKRRRNDLAHGSVSFVQCSESITVQDLKKYAQTVRQYLMEVISAFSHYIQTHILNKLQF